MYRWVQHINVRVWCLFAALLMLCTLTGCDYGDADFTVTRTVRLSITRAADVQTYDRIVSRAPSIMTTRYHVRIYNTANAVVPVVDRQIFVAQPQHGNIDVDVRLPQGQYTAYVWADWADGATGRSFFFDSSNFGAVTYTQPYNGNNELRDAFRAQTPFTVTTQQATLYQPITVPLPLERPLARYEFVSTDLVKFLQLESNRGSLTIPKAPDSGAPDITKVQGLSNYTVVMRYTGYMPHVFDIFANRPVDAKTGVSYNASINIISATEARLGFDYVMVNGHQSSVAVALEVYDPSGQLISLVNTINVPTTRNRNTVVRGQFLTSQAQGGVGIQPGFAGDHNIPVY